MRILFDQNVSKKLRRDLLTHEVVLSKELGWGRLGNGVLLDKAQAEFDVLLTMDANIYHQQNVAQYDISVIVLRAYDNDYQSISLLAPEILKLLEEVLPGNIYYVYVDDYLKSSDRKKGKGPYAEPG